MSAAIDYAAGEGDAGYTGSYAPMPGDYTDTAAVGPYVPRVAGQAWWESLVQYGVVRAIDNRLGPQNIAGNTTNGTFAGQNGKTYGNVPSQAAGNTIAGLPSWAVLAGVGVLAWLAIKG